MSEIELPEGTRASRVELRTADLRRSTAFYEGALGLSPAAADGGAVALSTGAGRPPLLLLREDRGAVPRPPRSIGLYHFAILYPSRKDLARALARQCG